MNSMNSRTAWSTHWRIRRATMNEMHGGEALPTPEPEIENVVADEIGVAPETVDLPTQIKYGVVVYQLENGSFGFDPMNDETTLDDVLTLVNRVKLRIEGQTYTVQFMEALAQAQQARRAPQQRIITPGG